jgi:integrase
VQRGSLKAKLREGVKQWRAQWREPGRKNPTTRWLGRLSDVTRAEARRQLDEIIGVSIRPTPPVTGSIALRRYVEDEYLTLKSRTWKGSTAGTTEQIIETHILAHLGTRSVGLLTRKELQTHLDSLAAAGKSASIVGHVRWQLAAIFKLAKSDKLVDADPTEGLVTPKCKDPGEKITVAVEDIQTAQNALSIREQIIFRLAACEGLRPGEVVAIQIGDIEGDGSRIRIRRRFYRGAIDSPKSWRGRRAMPLTPGTAARLAIYLEMLGEQKPDAWLFASETGITPISYSNVFRRKIKPVLRRVGLDNVNFQVLRRTFVTELGEDEPDPLVRATLAGHSVNVSENEYRQAKPEALRRAMDRLGERLQ